MPLRLMETLAAPARRALCGRRARFCSGKAGGEKDGGSQNIWQEMKNDVRGIKDSPFSFDQGRLTLPRGGGLEETDLFSKHVNKLMDNQLGLKDINDEKVLAKKMKEMESFSKQHHEHEKREYMNQTKEEKFRVEPSKVDLEGQAGGAKQQRARDIALNMNPFQGAGGGTFMDYVEKEQDYFSRGASTPAAFATAKAKAREVAVKTASEIRTTEVLGSSSVDQIFSKSSRNRNHNPLVVSRWDMNSFTMSTGQRIVGSVIMFQDQVFLWDVASAEDITMEKMMPIAHLFPVPAFLTLGTGQMGEPIHPDIHMYMRSRGTRIDIMPTDRAISTLHQTRIDGYQCATALLCLEPTNGFDFYTYNKFWKHQRDVAHGKKAGTIQTDMDLSKVPRIAS